MICTYCHKLFKTKSYDVSWLFNTRKGTVDTCSRECFNKVKQEHQNWLTWYVNYN